MPIVVGHGLLARTLSQYAFTKDCVILAAGVSNSGETLPGAFEREVQVVRSALRAHPGARAVYFSTCSVAQVQQTPYTRHKRRMESIVAAEASSFHIYRLPQVVGVTHNLTLISHFVDTLQSGGRLTIQSRARRNLLAASDVGRLVHHLVEGEFDADNVRTLVSGRSVPVLDILRAVAGILGVEPRFDLVQVGENCDFPAEYVRARFGADDPVLADDYWLSVLRRYVPLIAGRARGAPECRATAESAC